MTEFTQSLEKWLTLYHPKLITPLTFGHLEEFTPELKREYLAWCQTNGGRKYLEDGSEYNKKYERYCHDCSFTDEGEVVLYECLNCSSTNLSNNPFMTCDCGERVYLKCSVNECPNCERSYNACGQELVPARDSYTDE